MGFVFYDTETTGTSTDFDQILQFAAIRTDPDLNEVDRMEVRCRLRPHVVAHPMALRVTGMTIGSVTDPALRSHYEMMRHVRDTLAAWSSAIFVGYNSMSFDEHLLRQALFATLHPPYLTNTDGNARADALPLVQAAVAMSPGCLSIPTGDNGRPSFKLDRLAPANGFAHDALADVEATIHVAKLIRDREPDAWNRFVRFSSKAAVELFLEDEEAFLVTQVYFNRPFHYPVARFGRDPDNPAAALCLCLVHDPDRLAAMDDAGLAAFVAGSPRPIRHIKANSCPAIAPLDEVPQSLLQPHGPDELARRARRLQSGEELCRRLVEAVAAGRRPYDDPIHVEQQLYVGFAPPSDQARMERFHELDWHARAALVEAFEDARLRHHGRLIVHEHAVEALRAEHRDEVEAFISGRLHATTDAKEGWTSLPAAVAAVEALIAEHGPDEMLGGYRDHVLARLGAEPASRAA